MTLTADRARAAIMWDPCARNEPVVCRHPRLAHTDKGPYPGCHDTRCAIYRTPNGQMTGAPLCTAFVESNGGKDADEEAVQDHTPAEEAERQFYEEEHDREERARADQKRADRERDDEDRHPRR